MLLSAEELLELATRNATQEFFCETLANDVEDMEDASVLELKKVMFGLLYVPDMEGRAGLRTD